MNHRADSGPQRTVIGVAVTLALTMWPASSTADATPKVPGPRQPMHPAAPMGSGRPAHRSLAIGAAAQPPTTSSTYLPPVDAPITDPFRPPSGPYGPGNRGIEYATAPGTPVGAIGGGTVIFAGQVGGQLFVTVRHADGLRSSYSWLSSIGVTVGQNLNVGDFIGAAGDRFHLGVRLPDGTYIDPASLFGAEVPRHAVLDDAYLTVDGP